MSATWWIEHRGERVSRRWTDDPSAFRLSAAAMASAGLGGELLLIEAASGRTVASRELTPEAAGHGREAGSPELAAD